MVRGRTCLKEGVNDEGDLDGGDASCGDENYVKVALDASLGGVKGR